MRPKKHFETPDMFRSRLDQILNHSHPLFTLASQIDWTFFEKEFGLTYDEHMGRPGKPIRLMVGLQYLKHTFNFRHMKRLTRSARAWMKRRAAIEPIFGHLKSDNRMSKNYLKGREGDHINAILCGCGFNMRKLLAIFLLPYFVYRKIVQILKSAYQIDLTYSSCLL